MPGILDNMNCGEFFEGDKRNHIAAGISGALFTIAWWLMIDVSTDENIKGAEWSGWYFLCGVAGTIAFGMINMVSNGALRGDGYTQGCMGPRGARTWLFIGFVLGFVSVIAAGWILIAGYVSKSIPVWPGVAVFLHNVFIFISSLVFKFGRSEDLWG